MTKLVAKTQLRAHQAVATGLQMVFDTSKQAAQMFQKVQTFNSARGYELVFEITSSGENFLLCFYSI